MREIQIGRVYRHFKGDYYLVEAVARDSETEQPVVIYSKLYADGGLWIRPLSVFLSRVDREKYPDAEQIYRFEPVRGKNLVLIGMPGCGKSTVGVVLAKILGWDFIDVDLVIQKQNGKRLQEIIAAEGNEGFLEREADAVESLDCTNTVIATGGSAVLNPRGLKRLRELGKIVYLRHPYEEIARRIPNLATRGITLAPGQTLKDLYDYRTPIYEQAADITVDADNCTIEQTARAIQGAAKD